MRDTLSTPDAAPARPGLGRSEYLPTLDGWRAVAILWVMACHSQAQLFGPAGLFPSRSLARSAERGTFGVDIFFALSGLLICSRLLAGLRASGRIDLASFYVRRAFRILPPYVTFLSTIGILWALGVVHLGPLAYASCFGFLRNYIPEPYMSHDPFTAHAWSLSVEEHFYLLWPALLGLLATVARARRAAFWLGVASVAWSFVDINLRLTTRFLHLPINHHYWRTDYCIGGLFFGCWMALLLAESEWRDRLERRLSPAAWWALLGAFLWLATSVRENAARAIATPIVPLLLAGTLVHPGRLAGRILEWGPLRWVGRISYSLYLWQQLFLIPPSSTRPLGRLHDFPLDWIAALACALASYHLVEQPAIALGHRLSRRGRKGRTSTTHGWRGPHAQKPSTATTHAGEIGTNLDGPHLVSP
jgi:peptidoglycan/LPS O-acetylase OafA/YrhL